MNRNTVRVAAAVLAAGLSVSELAAIRSLADYRLASDSAVAVLPRVVVTPNEACADPCADAPRDTLARAALLPQR